MLKMVALVSFMLCIFYNLKKQTVEVLDACVNMIVLNNEAQFIFIAYINIPHWFNRGIEK